MLLGNGDGTFQPAGPLPPAATPPSLAVGDFNGDGKLDLATADQDVAGHDVNVLLGNGDGTFRQPINIDVGADPRRPWPRATSTATASWTSR